MSEKIGDAYIEVLMRGDKSSLQKLRSLLRKEGKAAGEDYRKAMDKARIDAATNSAQNIARRLKVIELPQLKQVGEETGNAHGEAIAKGTMKRLRAELRKGAFDSLIPKLDDEGNLVPTSAADWGPFWEKVYSLRDKYSEEAAEREITRRLKEQAKILDAQEKAERAAALERLKINAEAYNEERAQDRAQIRSIIAGLEERTAAEIKAARERELAVIAAGKREGAAYAADLKVREKAFGDSMKQMLKDYDLFVAGQRKGDESLVDGKSRLLASFRQFADEVRDLTELDGVDRSGVKVLFEDMEKGVIRVSPRMREINGRLDDFIPRMGRAFGRGSRSDIVNLFGGMVQGGLRAIAVVPKITEKVTGMISTFKALPDTLTTVQKLGQTFAASGLSVGKLGTAFGAFAVALPIVIAIVGVLIATMSMLLGVVVALASSLAFALGGALVAVAGAVIPLAAGIGVLVAAIASLSDAQKAALKTAIQPFVEGMKDIGKAAADAIFGGERFTQTIKDMTAGLASGEMKGLVVGIANAIGDVGAGWAKALNSEGFRGWLEAMGRTVPDQIRDLGQVAQNVLGGLGGFFLAAQPFISDFTQWLVKITEEFSNWANGDGQEEIVNFLERAKESAKAVGGFLGEIVGLIGDLFDAGKGTGDSIFDDLTQAVADFRAYIEEGGLEQWFKDTKDFADSLGGALKTVGEWIDAMDNAATRFTSSGAFKLLTWLADLGQLINDVTPGLGDFINVIDGLINMDFAKVKEGLLGMLPNPADFGLDIDWGAMVGNIVGFFSELGTGISTAISDASSGVWNFITEGLPTAFSEAMAGLGELGGLLLETLGALFTPVGEFFKAFFTEFFAQFGIDIGAVLTSIGTFFSDTWNGIVDVAVVVWNLIKTGWEELSTTLSEGFAAIGTVFAEKWDGIKSKASEGWNWVKDKWTEATTPLKEGFAAVQTSFAEKWDGIKGKASETWNNLKSGGAETWSNLKNGVSDFASNAGTKLGGIVANLNPIKLIIDAIKGAFNLAKDAAKGLADAVSKIKMPSLGSLAKAVLPGVATGGMIVGQGIVAKTKMASGGFVSTSSRMYRGANISEAGIEAVVPLQRPLGQVDPSVRDLAAYAQGKAGKAEKNYDLSGWTVVTQSEDTEAVAEEVVNRVLGGLL